MTELSKHIGKRDGQVPSFPKNHLLCTKKESHDEIIDLETLGIAFYISRPFKGHGLLTYWIMSPHLIDVTVSTKGFGRTVTNLNRSEIFTN